jgi:hypothetical protein
MRLNKTAKRLVTGGLALQLAILAIPATAEEGESSGTITATVTMPAAPEACIVLDADELDFGTVPFGVSGPTVYYNVSSCSEASQEYLIRGTNARSRSSDATWQLDQERTGLNSFSIGAALDGDADSFTLLMVGNQVLAEHVPAGDSQGAWNSLYAPLTGSDGAGETFEFDIVWTALLTD